MDVSGISTSEVSANLEDDRPVCKTFKFRGKCRCGGTWLKKFAHPEEYRVLPPTADIENQTGSRAKAPDTAVTEACDDTSIRLVTAEEAAHLEPLEILYEDPHFIAVNKPSGMVVHRWDSGDIRVPLIEHLGTQLGGRRVFIVHRLDAQTSGVIVLAFSSEIAAQLQECIHAEGSHKFYATLVRQDTPQ
ncbi:hypothetical protein CYMTET_25688, partial [Cymbomonas tetramitiformis]